MSDIEIGDKKFIEVDFPLKEVSEESAREKNNFFPDDFSRYCMKKSEIIKFLNEFEEKAAISSMAMMAFNPSIGRVFKEGSVDKFVEITLQMVNQIKSVNTSKDFKIWHEKFVKKVKNEIKYTSRGKPISYGQAQKPVNVFLKLYVDWANLPSKKIADRLRPFLHVPLDKVVMRRTRKCFFKLYNEFNLRIRNLSDIDENLYYSWQEFFKRIHKEKPLLIDVFWAIERFKNIWKKI